MTNLLIAFNDIGQRAKSLVSDRTHGFIRNIYCLESNKKYHLTATVAAHATISYTWDLGVGNSATANFLAFMSRYIVDIEIKLQASNNNFSSTTDIITVSSTDIENNRLGTYGADYFESYTESSAFRYWRIVATGDIGNIRGYFSKFFFGKLLDLERDPDSLEIDSTPKQALEISDGGYSFGIPTRLKKRLFVISWAGVSEEKLTELNNLFLIHKEPLIYLQVDNADIFDGVSLISCNIKNREIERVSENYNTIKLYLEEAI